VELAGSCAQQAVEERAILLQRQAQLLRLGLTAAVPLVFQSGSLLGKALSERPHELCYQAVGVADRGLRVVDETCLHLTPTIEEDISVPVAEQRRVLLTLQRRLCGVLRNDGVSPILELLITPLIDRLVTVGATVAVAGLDTGSSLVPLVGLPRGGTRVLMTLLVLAAGYIRGGESFVLHVPS